VYVNSNVAMQLLVFVIGRCREPRTRKEEHWHGKFTNLVLGIIVLEGMGKQLDPSLDIFKEFVPILLGMDRSNQIAAIRALF